MNLDAAPALTSLPTIEAEVWAELARAAQSKQHPWRTPVLATRDADAVDARTVILREVDIPNRTLLTYTDARAGKAAQLRAHPQGTLVMWSAERGWQIRCRVQLSVDVGGLAATSRWARISLTHAAHDYLSRRPPGAELTGAEQHAHDDNGQEPLGRGQFAVVSARVISIDWLELGLRTHRRARFDEGDARWLQP